MRTLRAQARQDREARRSTQSRDGVRVREDGAAAPDVVQVGCQAAGALLVLGGEQVAHVRVVGDHQHHVRPPHGRAEHAGVRLMQEATPRASAWSWRTARRAVQVGDVAFKRVTPILLLRPAHLLRPTGVRATRCPPRAVAVATSAIELRTRSVSVLSLSTPRSSAGMRYERLSSLRACVAAVARRLGGRLGD